MPLGDQEALSSRPKALVVISMPSIQASFWPSEEVAEVEDQRGKLVAGLGWDQANQPSWATWDCPLTAVVRAAWRDFKQWLRWQRWEMVVVVVALAAQEEGVQLEEVAQVKLQHLFQKEGTRQHGGSWWLAA